MEIQQLRAFFVTAATLKFSDTASKMRLTPAAVSIQVKKLEEELGALLFVRNKDKLALTQAGSIFLQKISPLFDIIDGARLAIRDDQSILKSPVVICAVYDIEQYYFQKILLFAKNHPELHLSILCRSNWDCVSLVASGQADFGLGRFGSVPGNLTAVSLLTVDPILVVPRNHALLNKKDLNLQDIMANPIVVLPKGTRFRSTIESVARKNHVTLKTSIEPATCGEIKGCILGGFGIGIVHDICIRDGDHKHFRLINVKKFFGSGEIKLIYRKKEQGIDKLKKSLVSYICD